MKIVNLQVFWIFHILIHLIHSTSIPKDNTTSNESWYRSIHEELQIIKENLDPFKDIMHHRISSALEWVIATFLFTLQFYPKKNLFEKKQVLNEKIYVKTALK